MDTKQEIRVLLIDHDKVFADHFRLYAAISNWKAEWLDTSERTKLISKIREINPNIILLDDRHELSSWLNCIKKENLIEKTFIVTGTEETHNEYFQQHGWNIGNIIAKPIPLAIIPDLVKNSSYYSANTVSIRNNIQSKKDFLTKEKEITAKEFESFANELSPSISIHFIDRHADANIKIWNNKSYNSQIFDESDALSLRLMALEIEESSKNFVRREEWNSEKGQWAFFRLYSLGEYYFWFVREYRDDSPQLFYQSKYDQEIETELEKDKLTSFLEKVFDALKQWGITRLRFYKVRQVYDDTKENEQEKSNYILTPYFSQGGGFKTSEEEWRKNSFTTQKTPDTKDAFLSKEWYYKTNKPNNRESACDEHIEWPSEPITRIEIPIFIEKKEKKKEPVGLLAFDRRYDHLAKERLLIDYAWWKEVFNKAGNINPAIINEIEIKKMEGFFKVAIGEIRDYRSIAKANQLKLWHEAFTETIRHLQEKIEDRDTFTSNWIVELFLNRLIEWWEYIDSEPMDDDDLPTSGPPLENLSILNWYFLKEESTEFVSGIGGYGEMARHYTKASSRKVSPFVNALNNKNDYKDNYLIQNFQIWLKKQNHNPEKSIYIQEQMQQTPNYWDLIQKIGSWAGFPIKAGTNHYLMIVHAKDENYFTTRRAKLLRTVALRLVPFLLWGDSANSQVHLLKMLNHELRQPLAIAKHAVNLMPKEELVPLALNNIGLLEAITKNMSYLYKPVHQKESVAYLKNVWEVVQIANVFAPEKQAIICCHDYDHIGLAVPEEVLRQIFFNLLGNAFKFSYGDYTPAVIIDNSREKQRLIFKISNRTNKRMTDEERRWIFARGYKVKESGSASGYGLGLTIVDMLCKQVHMECIAEKPEPTETDSIWLQTFTLHIPLAGEQ